MIFTATDKMPDLADSKYRTHLAYIKRLDLLTSGLELELKPTRASKLTKAKFEKFERLAGVTARSILAEKQACDLDPDYAQSASPWIPAKCYYQIYYLESIFLYLLNGSEVGFSSSAGHTGVISAIKQAIISRQLTVKGPNRPEDLIKIVTWEEADTFKAEKSATVRQNYFQDGNCTDSILGKISEYYLVQWKSSRRVDTFRSSANKILKAERLNPTPLCLLDYFYWMRIKTNYRDTDFLSIDTTSSHKAKLYLDHYISASRNYSLALSNAISSLKSARF